MGGGRVRSAMGWVFYKECQKLQNNNERDCATLSSTRRRLELARTSMANEAMLKKISDVCCSAIGLFQF
jgi:hypothetical protein